MGRDQKTAWVGLSSFKASHFVFPNGCGRMEYKITFHPAALRALKKLPLKVVHQMNPHLVDLSKEPRPPGCKKLKGNSGFWRVRVGDYRIVYQIDDGQLIILVIAIGHRKDIYQ
jgi:mRNA interferase RelE/StbE